MKKATSYYVRINSDNTGTVIIRNGVSEEEISTIDNISSFSAMELDNRAKLELQTNGVELVELEQVFMEDQKIDLSLVRTEMRKILKDLGDKSIPTHDKKDKLSLYQQACTTAQVLTNVCKLEVQIDAIEQSRKFK